MNLKKGLLALSLWCTLLATNQAINPHPNTEADAMTFIAMGMNDILNDFNELTEDEYRQRIQSLSNEIEFRIDPLIKDRIELRLEKAKTSTEMTLGKAEIYFPIFEEHLAKYDVPHLIKYLAIIESNLEPRARSHAGAGGLWQFMPTTGRMYKMTISSTIDDRCDTYKASESAAQLLAHLKNYHGDWCLALASYNCGAGRVNKAIKSAGTTDYWKVREYLPVETQKYVPYFMAMVYVGEFAAMHGLTPTPHHPDLVLTDTIHYFGSTTLAKLADEVGVGVDTVRFLNPSYLKNYIPRSTESHVIVLPARAVAQLRGYQSQWQFLNGHLTENPMRAVRRINTYEDLAWLAKAFRCTVKDLYIWNALPENYQVKAGDLIAIRKFNAIKDQPLTTAKRPNLNRNETIVIPALQVVALQNNKAITAISTDLPKLATTNNATTEALTLAAAPSAASKKTNQAPSTANNTRPSATTTTQEGDVQINRDRSRQLRGQSNVPTAVVEPAIAAAPQPERATTAPQPVVATKAAPAPTTEPKTSPEIKTVATTSNPVEVVNPQIQKVDEQAIQRSRSRQLRQEPAVATVAIPQPETVAVSPEPTPEEAPKHKNHCVAPNETLWDIIKANPNVTSKEIMEINRLRRATDIYPGLILKIPAR